MNVQPRDPFTTRQQREAANLDRFWNRHHRMLNWWLVVWILMALFTGYVGFGIGRAFERGVFP